MGKIRSCEQFLCLDVLVNPYILQYESALKHQRLLKTIIFHILH